jgi:hypothetical protein
MPMIIMFSRMREDFREDTKFKDWQEKINNDLQEIIKSDDSKSYEAIFTELGGLQMPNSTDCSEKLEGLIKRVVDEKLRKSQANEFNRFAYKILVGNSCRNSSSCGWL